MPRVQDPDEDELEEVSEEEEVSGQAPFERGAGELRIRLTR